MINKYKKIVLYLYNKDDKINQKGKQMEENYINIGKINKQLFKEIFKNILTDNVILTNERYIHIIERHKEDFEKYVDILPEILKEPDYILKDYKNDNTAMVIKHIKDTNTNINIILKLAITDDKIHTKNSIMTFYRVRDKNLRKLQEKNKTIYKKE